MSHWQPSSPPEVARRRAAMLERARNYFAAQQVLAVDTPALTKYPASDPNIDSVAALLPGDTYYLHTSPEACMKRLLAAGYPDIYSVCRVFRNNEAGRRHAVEFTMIEWYRLGYELSAIIADTTALIAACLDRPSMASEAEIRDYADAFSAATGLDAFAATVDELAATAAADTALRETLGDDRDAWLDLLMATIVAPRLPDERLTVLRHYPRSQAALARLCPADDRVADRFEVFLGTLELANGYVELTDAEEQRRRFDRDAEKRLQSGKAALPPDDLLLQALEHGLPDCAGVALGLERLQMIHERTDHMENVLSFSLRTGNE